MVQQQIQQMSMMGIGMPMNGMMGSPMGQMQGQQGFNGQQQQQQQQQRPPHMQQQQQQQQQYQNGGPGLKRKSEGQGTGPLAKQARQ